MIHKASGRADPHLRAATRPAGTASRDAAAPGADSIPGRSPRRFLRPAAQAGGSNSLSAPPGRGPEGVDESGDRRQKPPRRSGRRLRDRSDAGLLAEIRRVAALVAGATLPRTAFDRASLIGSGAISRRFGGWDRALARAGLGHRDSTRRLKRTLRLTDRQVLDRLRRSAAPDGVVTLKAVGRAQGLFLSTFVRRFGSWPAAVRRAGLCLSRHATPGPRRRRTPEERHRIPMMLRYAVLKRDDYRCQLCGDSPAITKGTTLEVDHVHPFSQGGKTTEDNLRTLCRRCNQGKGAGV